MPSFNLKCMGTQMHVYSTKIVISSTCNFNLSKVQKKNHPKHSAPSNLRKSFFYHNPIVRYCVAMYFDRTRTSGEMDGTLHITQKQPKFMQLKNIFVPQSVLGLLPMRMFHEIRMSGLLRPFFHRSLARSTLSYHTYLCSYAPL